MNWISVMLPVNRRICRQVLDCGDGVREVTALAFAALKTLELVADTATPTQSGDSENSVAAVQNLAGRRTIQEPIPLCNAGFPTGETRRLESRRYAHEVHRKIC
jgi:hypothetical protein